MASPVYLMPSASPSGHLDPTMDRRISPLPSDTLDTRPYTSPARSDISDAQQPSPSDSPSTSIETDPPTPEHEEKDVNTPISESDESDEDAEASGDDDYEVDTTQHSHPAVVEDNGSSTPEGRSKKRKFSEDFEDEIAANPDLYGVRRSHRTVPQRRTIEASTDEEDAEDSSYAAHTVKKRRKQNAGRSKSKTSTPALQSSEKDSDEEDNYVASRRQQPTKKQKQHSRKVAAGAAPPSQSHARFSARARNATNYNEDDDENDLLESESEQVTEWIYPDQNLPVIDLVLNHRKPEDVEWSQPDLNKKDFQYLIKWQGAAHYHAQWRTYDDLKGENPAIRLSKIDNYFKKIVETDILLRSASDVILEDKEKWILDRERAADALEECQQIERIIGSRRGDEGVEYYVKWKGLNYEYCTWEPKSLVTELDFDQIDKFLVRSQNLPKSDKLSSGRGKYQVFKTQPDYIKHGQLRDFQILGVNFLASKWAASKNVMLADEMGLGKTVQTIAFMNWLRHEKNQQGPFLIVVPLSTVPAWQETFDNWTPDLNYVVYNGNAKSRSIIQEYELLEDRDPRKTKFHALLTTYEYIGKDFGFLSQMKWQFMAVDEAHRLKNNESQLYTQLTSIKTACRLLITGTPMQNNLGELRALMDFLMPGEVNIEEDIDLSADGAQQKLAQLTDAIRPYMIRRTKQLVEKDLPPKTEKIMRVELSDIQLEYYRNILTRNFSELNRGALKGQKQSLLNIMMELKKASNHPYMFPNVEDRQTNGSTDRNDVLRHLVTSSGKMMLLEKLLDKLKKDGHRVLIFSQMVRMLDILQDYLMLRNYKFQRLDGTMGSTVRRHAIDHFNADNSDDFCFILSTRAGGLGINLMTADTVILFDSDWNPQADLQAMARAHRIGQKNPVTVYRFVSKDTVEEEVLERARNKLMLEFLTIQRGVTEAEIKEKLAKKGVNFSEPTSADDISRILKRRGQKMFEQTDNQKKLESLDIDAMLDSAEEHKTVQPEGITADGGEEFLKSFEYTDVKVDLEWDEIIPKEQLDAIRAEDEKRKHEAFLEKVAAEETSRQRKQTVTDDREQRAAKKNARAAAKAAAGDVSSDDSQDDPNRPLTESEARRLYQAWIKYGDLDEMHEVIMKEAKLQRRDLTVLKRTMEEIVALSKQAVEDEAEKHAELERAAGKSLPKKDKKETLFSYPGIKGGNAKLVLERPGHMRLLRSVIVKEPDVTRFRIPEAVKAVNRDFACTWGAREDGMLIVGITKHGWGDWVSLRDDPELNMKDKCFLEEQRKQNQDKRVGSEKIQPKKPTQVHLNRRANYLVSILRHKISGGTDLDAAKALENHHRNVKKAPDANGTAPRKRAAAKVRDRRNSHGEARANVDRRGTTGPRDRTGTPDNRRKGAIESDRKIKRRDDDEDDRDLKRHKSSDGVELKRLKAGDDKGDRDTKRRRIDDGLNGKPNHRRTDDQQRLYHNGEKLKNKDAHSIEAAQAAETPKYKISKANGTSNGEKVNSTAINSLGKSRLEEKTKDEVSKSGKAFADTPKPGNPSVDKTRVERDVEADRQTIKILSPVSADIKLIPMLGKDKAVDKTVQSAKITASLVAIGDFIEKQFLGRNDEREKLWEYTGHKCFRGMAAEKMKLIYERKKAAADGISMPVASSVVVNGHSKGD